MKNINCLKDLSKTIETSINELKSIILKINKNKEQLKTDIQKIFTKIRNIINNREDELLLELDKEYDNLGFNDNIIKDIKNISIKIQKSLEYDKISDKDWNNENNLIHLKLYKY